MHLNGRWRIVEMDMWDQEAGASVLPPRRRLRLPCRALRGGIGDRSLRPAGSLSAMARCQREGHTPDEDDEKEGPR